MIEFVDYWYLWEVIMSRKLNVKLIISVVGGGGLSSIYCDLSYLDWVLNSLSEFDFFLLFLKGGGKKFLWVGFMDMEESSDNNYNNIKSDVESDINWLLGKGFRSKRFVELRMLLLGKLLNYC